MNEEIKEILDRLDYNEWEVALYKVPITWCELYDIRDYITNLQQELEMMVKDDERSQETIIRLTKENERLKENNQNMQKEMCKCWQRIDKAIEYIKNNDLSYYPNEENLLNILQGSYKE